MINPDERLGAAGNFLDDVDVELTTGVVSVKSAALSPGVYVVTADVDTFFLIGPQASVAATLNSIPIWAKQYMHVEIKAGANDSIAAILASGTGTFYAFSVDR
jgi:hypothetical protein